MDRALVAGCMNGKQGVAHILNSFKSVQANTLDHSEWSLRIKYLPMSHSQKCHVHIVCTRWRCSSVNEQRKRSVWRRCRRRIKAHGQHQLSVGWLAKSVTYWGNQLLSNLMELQAEDKGAFLKISYRGSSGANFPAMRVWGLVPCSGLPFQVFWLFLP